MAVGTLYNHFADRETLLLHVMETRKHELFQVLDERLRELARAGFVEQLTAVVGAMFEHVESHHGLFVVAILEGMPHKNEILRELHERFDKLIEARRQGGRVLREARRSEAYAAMLLGSLRGVMMREIYGAPSGLAGADGETGGGLLSARRRQGDLQ